MKRTEESIRHEQKRPLSEPSQIGTAKTQSPIQIQTRTVNVDRKIESKQTEQQLPSTGESTNAFGLIGLALTAMGLAGLKRKRESK